MSAGLLHYIGYQLVNIIDFADSGNGISPMVRSHNQGLGLKIRDATDAQVTLHVMDIIVKLGTEGRVLNVVNGTVETVLPVHCQTGPAGSQMGMIVRAEKQIKYAIFF
jgi:hypothetical protein